MKNKIYNPKLLVLTIGLGTLLNPLNSSMISVALTRMQREFGLNFADASWLISIFYLASAAAQPVMGKLSDMFGPKRMFLTGLVLVAAASIMAPFSPNFTFLVGCRALQAIGSSTLFPSGMSMVRNFISDGQAKAIATLSIFASTSAAFGPSVGGFLISSWDWPAIFLINIPFIIIGFTMAIVILPNTGQGTFELKKIDFAGISLFIITMTSLILFLLSLEARINLWALLAFIVSAAGFYLYEQKRTDPFIDVIALRRNQPVLRVYLQYILINLVYYCYFFGFPLFLQQALFYSEKHTGIIMLALAGSAVVMAPAAGRLIDKNGSRKPLLIGAFLLTIGTALLLTFQGGSPLFWLIVIMVILGLSTGFNNISMQTALYEHIEPEETGAASGLFQTSRYIGSILSSSLLGIAFNSHLDFRHLHFVAWICLIFCGLIILLSFMLPKKQLAE